MGLSLLLIAISIGHKTGTLWDVSIPVTRFGVLTHLALVQDAFQSTRAQINHAFWSIAVEWRIYFAFPLLVVLWVHFGALKTTFAAILFSYVLLAILFKMPINTRTDGVTPQYLGLFALGMLGAHLFFGNGRMAHIRFSSLILPTTFVLLIIMGILSKKPIWHGLDPTPAVDLFVGLFCTALIVFVSTHPRSLVHRWLSWKPLVFIGSFSYSIYLIHAPLLQVLWQTLFVQLHGKPLLLFTAYIFVGLPIIIAIAYLFHLAFERPFMSKPAPKTERQAELAAIVSPAP